MEIRRASSPECMHSNRLAGFVWGVVTLAAGAWVASCGSGDRRGISGPGAKQAALIVTVRGLPDGVAADVTLHIGSTAQTITATDTVRNLAPGTYTIDAGAVETARARFGTTNTSQQITLAASESLRVAVDYAELTGDLAVGVDGLTGTAVDTIVVTGPNGFTTQLAQAETLWKLTPGSYHVVASSAGTAPRLVPDTSARDVRVDSARVASVDVRYHPVASLTINISGLPAGTPAAVDIAGASFSQRVTATTTLFDLPLGTYTIAPASVLVGPDTYASSAQSVTLSGNTPSVVSVVYTKRVGQIAFQITGGAAGLGAPNTGPIVTVTGPAGNFAFSNDTVLTPLPLGAYQYSVTPPQYTATFPDKIYDASGATYTSPLAGVHTITLDSATTAASISIPLALTRGTVTFAAAGAPIIQLPDGGTTGASLQLLNPVNGGVIVIDSSGGGARPGAYTTHAFYPVQPPYDMYWPDVLYGSLTVSGGTPIINVVTPYHKLVWPVVKVDFDGMPRTVGRVIFDSQYGQLTAPTTLPNSIATVPDSQQLIAFMLNSADTAAWTPIAPTINYVPVEGQTITVVIHMRQTNMMHATFTSPVPIPAGTVVATFADGTTESNANEPAGTFTFEYVDAPGGAMSVVAAPFTYNGTQYVADNPTQSTTLGPGNTKFTVTYSAKVTP